MIRVVIGSAAAAVAMFIIGFIFFGLGLQNLAIKSVGDLQAAPIQQTLRAHIAETGTYAVPGDLSPEQTRMYGTGPVATIHYNVEGQVAWLNAGTALYAANLVDSIPAGLVKAREAVASGAARAKLDQFVTATRSFAK